MSRCISINNEPNQNIIFHMCKIIPQILRYFVCQFHNCQYKNQHRNWIWYKIDFFISMSIIKETLPCQRYALICILHISYGNKSTYILTLRKTNCQTDVGWTIPVHVITFWESKLVLGQSGTT